MPTPPTAGAIARQRRNHERLLTARASIRRPNAPVQSETGGWEPEAGTVVATDVPCRMAPAGGREYTSGSTIAAEATHVVTMPADTDVRNEDTIIVDGRELAVIEVRNRTDGFVTRVHVSERV